MSASSEMIETPKPPWHRSMAVLLTVLVIADVVSAIESSMIYAAFKAIIQDTGDPIGAGWLVSAYFVVAGPAAVVAGRLGDMYGRKKVLIYVLLVVMAGSVLSAFSPNMTGTIIGRGLQGVSGAILPLCISLLRQVSTPQRFSFGLGVLLSAHALGTMLGLLLGGVIVDAFYWRAVFAAAAGAAAFALVGIVGFTPSSTGVPQKLDWFGLGVAPVVAALLFAISSLNKPTISTYQVVGTIAGALLLLAVWVWHELRQKNPLVDLRALKNRDSAIGNLIAFFVAMGPSHISLYFSLLVQQPTWTGIGFGKSASAAGLLKAPFTTASALLGPVAGYAAGRWGTRAVLLTGACMLAVGWTSVALYPHAFWVFMGLMAICSWGAMITTVGLTGMITFAAPPEKTGEAQGLLAICKSVGNAIGAQIIALLLSLSLVRSADGKEAFPDVAAHTITLSFIAGCCVVCLVLAFASRRSAATDGAASSGARNDAQSAAADPLAP